LKDVDKFDGRSAYSMYKPTTDIREQSLEKYWMNKRNKQLAKKRENEENIKYMMSWA